MTANVGNIQETCKKNNASGKWGGFEVENLSMIDHIVPNNESFLDSFPKGSLFFL